MRALAFAVGSARPLRLLCLGAHSDDMEIGAGGSILELLSGRRPVDVDWVVFSGDAAREKEARRSAALFLKGARSQRVIVKQFRDGFFPYEPAIKQVFEDLKAGPAPDVVLTHFRDDRHQDHRVLSDLAWNTFRDHLVLEYEIPKYDGDLGSPNCFVALPKDICQRKIKHICDVFQTQSNKAWLTEVTFLAMLRLRGVECAAPEKYAEAFYCRKFFLGTDM